jgi:hypothetical protein
MSGEHDPNREYDARFPLNADQRYTTYTDYVRSYLGSEGDGKIRDTATQAKLPPPLSEAEIRRLAEAKFLTQIQDRTEHARRENIYALIVEAGLGHDAAFSELARYEQRFINQYQTPQAGTYERSMAAYMQQNPLQDFNDWASRQGNAWCVKLNKAATKRSQQRGQTAASKSPGKPGKANPGLVLFFLFLGIGFWVTLGWLIYKFFIK